jgi:hypothetical protein
MHAVDDLTIDRGNSGDRDPLVEYALSRYTINVSHALIILRLNRGRCLEGLAPPPTANLMKTRQVSAWVRALRLYRTGMLKDRTRYTHQQLFLSTLNLLCGGAFRIWLAKLGQILIALKLISSFKYDFPDS